MTGVAKIFLGARIDKPMGCQTFKYQIKRNIGSGTVCVRERGRGMEIEIGVLNSPLAETRSKADPHATQGFCSYRLHC